MEFIRPLLGFRRSISGSTQEQCPQIYYSAAAGFPDNKCKAEPAPPARLQSANRKPDHRPNAAAPQPCNPPGGRALRHKVEDFQAALRVLDTSKLVHIWYTTITTCGWSVLEFNDSSVVIGICKVDYFGAAHFHRMSARMRVSLRQYGKLQDE